MEMQKMKKKSTVSRRGFFKSTIAGAAAFSAARYLTLPAMAKGPWVKAKKTAEEKKTSQLEANKKWKKKNKQKLEDQRRSWYKKHCLEQRERNYQRGSRSTRAGPRYGPEKKKKSKKKKYVPGKKKKHWRV